MIKSKLKPSTATIEEGELFIRDNIEKGCICPVCKGTAKLYKRKINSGMTLFLIGLYKLRIRTGKRYHQNKNIMSEMDLNTSSLDYSVLKHFGLIKDQENEDTEKRKSGFWCITKKGAAFVLNEIKIPSHVHLYNNVLVGFSETTINITEALGNKFNYKELLNERG